VLLQQYIKARKEIIVAGDFQRGRNGGHGGGYAPQLAPLSLGTPGAASASVTSALLARSSSGLCHCHRACGDGAFCREALCSLGN
jgi:hypothetical protein